jgi:hypothetical protein
MGTFTVPGVAGHTVLRFTPADAGKVALSVVHGHTDEHPSVVLQPDWLLPLAAWFAGEAQPAALGDRPGTLYGWRLDVRGDELAVIWNTHTWARLDCVRPFGVARVLIGPRGRGHGKDVMLWPEARQDAAAWLRRTVAGKPTSNTAV